MLKNILYIHGYNSSGSTGKLMEKLFKERYGDSVNVYAPKISPIYQEARVQIDEFLKQHDIDLIVGTSLGGFLTLDTHGYFRIVVNPILHPYKDLQAINAKKEDYESYENVELFLDNEDGIEVFGMFGDEDEVMNYQEEYKKNLRNFKIIKGMKHQMSEKDIQEAIIPMAAIIDSAKNAYNNYLNNKNNYELL